MFHLLNEKDFESFLQNQEDFSNHLYPRTSCLTELFEKELFICIKIDLALNNLQRLICQKSQTLKQTKYYDIADMLKTHL